ncbi:MAG: hypothetical protein WCD70_16960 [Alphaproteobacteria bacterium]
MQAISSPQSKAAGNALELTSVYALLAYIAQQQNIDEDIVRAAVTKRFDVDDITQLPVQSYDKAIKFLVDYSFE